MSDISEKKGAHNCPEFNKCLEILHLMLDSEATTEQEVYLQEHIEKCMFCFEQYEIEKQIRELLRSRLTRQPVPQDLASIIYARVFQSA